VVSTPLLFFSRSNQPISMCRIARYNKRRRRSASRCPHTPNVQYMREAAMRLPMPMTKNIQQRKEAVPTMLL
jgi:hypothetical protein